MAHEQKVAALLAKYDTNHDGRVTKSELDKNGDGAPTYLQVSPTEMVLKPGQTVKLHASAGIANASARTRSALLESAARGLSRYGYGNLVLAELFIDSGVRLGLRLGFEDVVGMTIPQHLQSR